MKLTQAFVKRVHCPMDKTKVEYCDDDLKGFLLDVRKSGGKTYYLRLVTSEGKRKYHRIADATILPLEEAKGKALKLKRSIEEGKEVTLSPKEEHEAVPTLERFYYEHYLAQGLNRIKVSTVLSNIISYQNWER